MLLTFNKKDFESDIDFILFHQKDETPEYWKKRLFEAYPALDYKKANSLPERERLVYITEQMKIQAKARQNVIDNAIKSFQKNWNNSIAKGLNSAYSSAFDNDCTNILNDMTAFVGLNPICPRNLEQHTFDIYHYFDSIYTKSVALHEITHFVWFYFWQKHFADAPKEYEFPHLKWLLSEIVVETIMRNSKISELTDLPKYISYSYFYDMKINNILIFDTMKEMYQTRKNIYDFMEKSLSWIQLNETELREKIVKAENKY